MVTCKVEYLNQTGETRRSKAMNKAATAMSYDELRAPSPSDIARCPGVCSRSPNSCSIIRPRSRSARSRRLRSAPAFLLRRSSVSPTPLGFGGFTQMQQVFRSRLVAGVAPSYKARLARIEARGKIDSRSKTRGSAWAIRRGGAVGAAGAQSIGACARTRSGNRHPCEGPRHLPPGPWRVISSGDTSGVCAAKAWTPRRVAGRHWRQHPRTIASGHLRRRAGCHQLPKLLPGYSALISRVGGATGSCDLDYRQSVEPDRRGARRLCSRSRTCPSRRCALWSRRCASFRPSPSASISPQTEGFTFARQTTVGAAAVA